MWKWLRSWFAWRFSLRRLVIATVFLGAVVGLNMRQIGPVPTPTSAGKGYRYANNFVGWPLPIFRWEDRVIDEWDGRKSLDWTSEIPLTHRTYDLLSNTPNYKGLFVLCAITNTLVALIPLFLILFLQIPRRKPPDPKGAK